MEHAETANKAKDQFLAALSHELRTPLTPVLATLSAWEVNPQIPRLLRDDIQMMRRNIELETRLIDDLLDLTRITKAKLRIHLEPADLHTIIAATLDIVRTEFSAKQILFHHQLQASPHHLLADPGRFQQILWNLLKNAAKFTPERGSVTLSTSNDPDGSIRLTLHDNGIGMTPETLARIFLPFEQASHDTAQCYGGLGLGLAITNALVRAHHGAITATSEGPYRGSTFTLTFPSIDPPSSLHRPANNHSSASKHTHRVLSILLAEDHLATANVMSRLLQHLGHHVQIAHSVADALQLLAAPSFDLIISDLGLPDGTGFEILQKSHLARSIPAIALTGFGMEDDAARCLQAGFLAHVPKPVNFQRLQSLLDQVLNP